MATHGCTAPAVPTAAERPLAGVVDAQRSLLSQAFYSTFAAGKGTRMEKCHE